MIGTDYTPTLKWIAEELWDYEEESLGHHGFTDQGLKAAAKIFTSAMMDKMFELQELDEMDMDDRIKMGRKLGEDLRKLIWTYTNVDSKELYKR